MIRHREDGWLRMIAAELPDVNSKNPQFLCLPSSSGVGCQEIQDIRVAYRVPVLAARNL